MGPLTWPARARGFGAHEVPRGALGHWVEIADGDIANYQVVAPTHVERLAPGRPRPAGPYEQALAGTRSNPARPIEMLRTVRSFDPCVACAVHVLDARRG